LVTGKRHPFSHDYQAGFDDQGRLLALQSTQWVHCGFSADLSGPVADRAVFHTDNAYFLEAVDIVSHRSKLNTQSHTAFRGFGGPQGMLLIETVMGDIARQLQLDPLDVRLRNLYGEAPRNTTPYGMRVEDNILPRLMPQLAIDCDYRATARRDSSLERAKSSDQTRHRTHPREIRHQLHRHPVQPSGCFGLGLHRWQRTG
jgi:xanthine dehydrogenase large subunit